MSGPELPRTPAQEKAHREYRDACERLANASVRLKQARSEHEAAMSVYNEAHGAALQAGVLEK